MNFADALRHFALLHSTKQKPAIIFKGKTVSFTVLHDRVLRLAAGLQRLGVEPGDNIGVILWNSPHAIEIFAAASYLGALVVPLSSFLVAREIEHLLGAVDVKAVVYDTRLDATLQSVRPALTTLLADGYVAVGPSVPDRALGYEALLERQPVNPARFEPGDGPCWIAFTGGTTGKPKACIITHANLSTNLFVNATQFGWTQNDRHLTMALLAHGLAFATTIGQLLVGGTVCILETFSPLAALVAIEKYRLTWTALVPTILNAMVNEPTRNDYDVSSLRVIVCGGGPLPPQTAEQALNFFANAGLFNYYGSTEMGWITVLRPEDQLRKAGSVGQPMLGAEVRIVDETGGTVSSGQVGQIFKRGMPYTATLYKNAEAEAKMRQGDWLTSGDLGLWDEEGYLYLKGRSEDIIVSGGMNVYAIEVEIVLNHHPMVAEVAVIGIPDERWGEALHAAVVLKTPDIEPQKQQLMEEELKDLCQAQLAAYKRPKSYEFMAELPKSHVGKIMKQALRSRHQIEVKPHQIKKR